jgi:hypothetical protein
VQTSNWGRISCGVCDYIPADRHCFARTEFQAEPNLQLSLSPGQLLNRVQSTESVAQKLHWTIPPTLTSTLVMIPILTLTLTLLGLLITLNPIPLV